MRLFADLSPEQRLGISLAALAGALVALVYMRGSIAELSEMAMLPRSPLNDIDLSASTDFEDSVLVACEALSWAEQDYALFFDGGCFGLAAPTEQRSSSLSAVR